MLINHVTSILPLAIVGAHRFYDTLTDFLSVIGYWASSFAAIMLVEHLYFRRASFANYDVAAAWNTPRLLPPGIAALSAMVLSMGLVVPGMAQIWYVGPIGEKTGDIGFEVAFFLSGLLYFPLRTIEKRRFGR
jgi:purine-cytosine permease-like protein